MQLNGLIQTFPKELKLLIGVFIIVLSIGFFTGLLFVGETSSANPDRIEEQYLGNETDEDAMIMNLLYDMMGTDKGYPTVKKMCDVLENESFEVTGIAKAPSLELSSESLMTRYFFDKERMGEIVDAVLNEFGKDKQGVFNIVPEGFNAYLHYMIFSCKAV